MSNYCDAVISHGGCDFDSNCGLTCDGVFQRELAVNPGIEIPPGFYDDFMSSCIMFYWPDGCPLSSASSVLDSSVVSALSASNEVLTFTLLSVVFFISFLGGFMSGSR